MMKLYDNILSEYNNYFLINNEFYYSLNEDINYNNEILSPIYIVCMGGNSVFSAGIKYFTNSMYSHAMLAFDLNFDKLYSFKVNKGFSVENFSILKIKEKLFRMVINVIFVNKIQKDKLLRRLIFYKKNVDKTGYNYLNALQILFNKKDDTINELKLVCSVFVAIMLKSVGITICNKPINLITPEDLANSYRTNSNIHNIFNDKFINFSYNKVKRNVDRVRYLISQQQTLDV